MAHFEDKHHTQTSARRNGNKHDQTALRQHGQRMRVRRGSIAVVFCRVLRRGRGEINLTRVKSGAITKTTARLAIAAFPNDRDNNQLRGMSRDMTH